MLELELEVGKELWATNGEYRESDNYVQWLADGASAMYEMCDAFCKATKFIYLIPRLTSVLACYL